MVRFRLKKLLPFDAEHAVLSYQVMSSGRDGLRLLAVAMPCDVLSEYESVVTDTGYLPGAVLPSTLAALAGLDAGEDKTTPALVVNAGPETVTTAIVRGDVLLLHRTVDLRSTDGAEEGEPELPTDGAGERTRRTGGERLAGAGTPSAVDALDYDRMDAETEMQSRVLGSQAALVPQEADEAVRVLNDSEAVSVAREITQAVSVAAAYFEDTLGGAPPAVLAAGTLGAERLRTVLAMYGMDGMRVREMVDATAIDVGASNSTVQRGWLAGVRGALRS